jgi:hypothetical protein
MPEAKDRLYLLALFQRALEEIAAHGEELAEMGEPQNNVPEFCRAILRGEDVHLDNYEPPSGTSS